MTQLCGWFEIRKKEGIVFLGAITHNMCIYSVYKSGYSPGPPYLYWLKLTVVVVTGQPVTLYLHVDVVAGPLCPKVGYDIMTYKGLPAWVTGASRKCLLK